ncbi:MAG: DMT family transporter, partial [Bdellovibrionales bacterium]
SSVRCFVPGLFVSLVFLFRGDPLSWTDWREGGVLSLARRAIPQGALTWAALQIPSGISSLIVSTIPIWVVFLEGFGGKKASNPVARYGAIIGLFGLTLIAVDSSRGNLAWFPLLVLVTAMILNAAGMCWSSARPGQAVRVVGPELAVGGIILFVLSLFSGELSTFSIGQVSEKSMLALVFLTVFASGLAPVALAWAMTVKDASHATSFMFYVPIISLALGCTVGKEQLHTLSIIACVFLLLSVYLIRKRRLP